MAGVDPFSVQHPQQPATNVHGLNGGGHPHRGATAPRRKIIARVQELIPDMQALRRLQPVSEILLECLHSDTFVADVNEHVVATVERTKRHVGPELAQIMLHAQNRLVELLAAKPVLGVRPLHNPYGARLSDEPSGRIASCYCATTLAIYCVQHAQRVGHHLENRSSGRVSWAQ